MDDLRDRASSLAPAFTCRWASVGAASCSELSAALEAGGSSAGRSWLPSARPAQSPHASPLPQLPEPPLISSPLGQSSRGSVGLPGSCGSSVPTGGESLPFLLPSLWAPENERFLG